ncbi:hypothetical protein PCASD_25316 [Puccinia coronata f. sp. avenae]|uniref:Uncharacterized protein n=1 Tax=Puccinia coronata f. sp. avenae TaxID=200324 RepID=A0A2N5S678_9BASI|nr:hypothetical protein PCASD_25316 [Puccinia coronata f. sp. avenae]
MNTNHIYLLLSLALYPGTFSLLTGFDPKHLPRQSDPQGHQTGYNQCGTTARPDSKCQNLFIYSAERTSASLPRRHKCQWVQRSVMSLLTARRTAMELNCCSRTPHYVQITGLGDFTKVNVPPKDEGGEMDPSGADGHGNPAGGLVFGEKGSIRPMDRVPRLRRRGVAGTCPEITTLPPLTNVKQMMFPFLWATTADPTVRSTNGIEVPPLSHPPVRLGGSIVKPARPFGLLVQLTPDLLGAHHPHKRSLFHDRK